jgi:hypothetical protein
MRTYGHCAREEIRMKVLVSLLAAAGLSGCVAYPSAPYGAPYGSPGAYYGGEMPYYGGSYYGGGYYDSAPVYIFGGSDHRRSFGHRHREHGDHARGSRDRDHDGIPDRVDRDRDGDGVPDRRGGHHRNR